MLPLDPASRRRPHPDQPDSDADTRRVRARTPPAADGVLPALAARAPALPSTSWGGAGRPRTARLPAPAAWVQAPSLGQAGRSAALPTGTAPIVIPPEGRNTLAVYAAEQRLRANGRSKGSLPHLRSALTRFGDALLRQQAPTTIAEFVADLASADPAQRAAAEGRRDAMASELRYSQDDVARLKPALNALIELPPGQRQLTLEQALQSAMKAPALQTLLPQADRALLQEVAQADRSKSPVCAGQRQVLLTRLGIALAARGHGGLAGWHAMHDEAGGYRRAKELLDRFVDSPELALSHTNKGRLRAAAEQLRDCGFAGAGSVPDQAGVSSPPAPLVRRFPNDFPPQEAGLIEACLQAGLDSGLSRSTLSHYGRELIGLSEWLRRPAAGEARLARPTGLQVLLDLSQAGRHEPLQELVHGFAASRPPTHKALPAVDLLLQAPGCAPTPGAAAASAALPAPDPGPASPAAAARPEPPGPSGTSAAMLALDPGLALLEAAAEPEPPGAPAEPAAAATSPVSAWSLGSAFDQWMDGRGSLDGLLRDMDEAMSNYRPAAALLSESFELDDLFQQFCGDDTTQMFLQTLGGTMDLRLAAPEASALDGIYDDEQPPPGWAADDPPAEAGADGAAVQPLSAEAGADGAAVQTLSAQAAVRWYQSRLQDVQMVEHVHPRHRAEMMRFAQYLTEGGGEDVLAGLGGFLRRYEGSERADRAAARQELQDYVRSKSQERGARGREERLVQGLDTLAGIPAGQRGWTDPARRLTPEQVHHHYRPWLLPPQDRALMEQVSCAQRQHLSRFARQLLDAGHGGLTHWLMMFHQGNGQWARRLMLDFARTDPINQRRRKRKVSVAVAGDRLQAFTGTPSGLRLAVQGAARTTVGASAQARAGRGVPGDASAGALAASPRDSWVWPGMGTSSLFGGTPQPGSAPGEEALRSAASSSAGWRSAGHPPAEGAPVAPPVQGANTLMAYALSEVLAKDGHGLSTVQNMRVAMIAFGDQLLQQLPPCSLADFLAQRRSADPGQRAAAEAAQAAIVQSWTKNRRNEVERGLRRLSELPPEQQQWSLQQALQSNMKAAALKTLLSQGDRQLLHAVQDRSADVSGAVAGRHQLVLSRFAAMLMVQGCAGLTQWLEMHHDAAGHSMAKEWLEGFGDHEVRAGREKKKDAFLPAVKRLYEVWGMPETESLCPELPVRSAAAASRYPDDFPPAEAQLIDGRLAAGQARGLARRTLENYQRELIRLSEWLRKPPGPDRQPEPRGLQSLITLARATNDAALWEVRQAFFGPGRPGSAAGAFDLLVEAGLE